MQLQLTCGAITSEQSWHPADLGPGSGPLAGLADPAF
jgi:hypothetical protein